MQNNSLYSLIQSHWFLKNVKDLKLNIYLSKGPKIPNLETTTWGAKTYSDKNLRRTDSKISKFDKVAPGQQLTHLQRLRASLEGFQAANVNKNSRAEHLHNVYRAKNSYFNDKVADAFGEKKEEGYLDLNFGHLDNAYFTRSNDEAFSTVFLRLRNYADKITGKENQDKLSQADNVPTETRDAILEEFKKIKKLIDNINLQDKLVSFGWTQVRPVENMRTEADFTLDVEPLPEFHHNGMGQPSWTNFNLNQKTAYTNAAMVFNEIKNSTIPEKDKYQFFSDVLSYVQSKEGVKPKWPQDETVRQTLQNKFVDITHELVLGEIKSSPELSRFFCQNAEDAFDVSVRYFGIKAKDDTQCALTKQSGVKCVDKNNVTIATFTDPLPAAQARASGHLPQLSPLQLRINVDIAGHGDKAGASALEMRKFFIELSKKINLDLKSVASIEINNDVLQGTWPSFNPDKFFRINQIGISFKAGTATKKIYEDAKVLDDFTKKFFKLKHTSFDTGSAIKMAGLDYVTQIHQSQHLLVNGYIKNSFAKTPGFGGVVA
ncbi:hypothetical protein AB870_25490 (plasmid) [Pandoraea faecigallinarum]|uniref:Uncharacterized protein n=1 Tax=Pandoraea faecigallinarum TaxID=656179 RepID=A0A0H3X450_9BURK|nr:hypothetical protein AB870_25490 [Pandoraea faecigallinarum]